MKLSVFVSGVILVSGLLSGCLDEGQKSRQVVETELSTSASGLIQLDVHKTPTCGCCGDWVEHIERSGFSSTVHHHDSLALIKSQLGIPDNARSCHTSISKDGYVFEGHVPAKYISAFLENPPKDAQGLIVPAMPLGSPGMEYQNQFNPYTIWLLKKNGEMQAFADVGSYEQQF